ncbi:Protein UmuC [Entomobacter blattae]|uniref:DNA-directed DNA polymerase n=1 Tax=Entomobacter blattae TaxID=2762277 RepID=A0A7H1NRK2_9PROT|nr:Protein UmuC [Entomobacter blattae]
MGVLSNNDGCVVSRSNEIKPHVKMVMPAYQILDSIKQQAVLLSSNYELYGDISARVVNTLKQFSNRIEVYSIDESFLYLPALSLEEVRGFGLSIRETVKKHIGIPVGVGIGTTHTLAKFANFCVKQLEKCNGVCVFEPNSEETKRAMQHFPVGELWGVGRKLAPKLVALGIHTVWNLRNANPVEMRRRFSVVVEKMVYELRGISCIEMGEEHFRQNIMTSRSFGKSTSVYEELAEAVRRHAAKGGEKLRAQKSVAKAIMVLLKTNKHRIDLPQYYSRLACALPIPTNDSRTIIKTALVALQRIYKPNYHYIKAGVIMMLDTAPVHARQASLLDAIEVPDKQAGQALMKSIDVLNKKFGGNTVTFGSCSSTAPWQMRRNSCTPHYTTDWRQLAIVKAH